MADAKDLVFTVLGIDKASKTFDRVGESMDRMARRATLALGGITAASAVSAAAVGAAVGALPLAFIGLGAVAVRENAEVRRSFEDLSTTVRTGLAADAAPLADAFVGAADQIGASYERLRPGMQRAFQASVPYVETLTGGVTDLAEGAMPGMVRAVERAGPAVSGLRTLMGDAGIATGEFFDVISESSEDAGRGLEHLGALVRGVLPEMGGLLGDLTGLWADHGDEVVDVVTRIVGVLGDLTGNALPVLSEGLGVALEVLQGVLAVIEPMAPILGPVIGSWLALGTAMRGMRAVRGVVDGISTSVQGFADTTAKAATSGGVGKLRAAAGGLVGMLGGPFGIALAAASVGLALFGQKSQAAADDQRALASALRDSNGQFDAQGRAAIANSEAYQDIAGSVEKAGLSHAEFIDAIIAGGPELDALRKRLETQVAQGRSIVDAGGAVTTSYTDQAASAKNLLDGLGGLREMVDGAIVDFELAAEASDTLSGTLQGSVPGADALREALTTLSDQTADTAERADALNEAWRRLFGIALSLEEATAAFEGGLDDIADSIEGVKEESDNWQSVLLDANGALDITTEAGRTLSQQLIAQGEDYRTLAQTAYDSALQQGQSQAQATQAAVDAVTERRAQFIAEMHQLGFTEDQARQLADRYLGMPRDVVTTIRSPGLASAIAQARSLTSAYDRIPRYIRTVIETVAPGPFGAMMGVQRFLGSLRDGGRVPGYADGGRHGVPAFPHGGRFYGRGGPRDDANIIAVSGGEFINNADSTDDYLDVLSAINSRDHTAAAQAMLRHLTTSGALPGTGDRFAAQLTQQLRPIRSGNDLPPGVREVALRALTRHAPAPAPAPAAPPVHVGNADELFLAWLRKAIATRGGDVQLVLGP